METLLSDQCDYATLACQPGPHDLRSFFLLSVLSESDWVAVGASPRGGAMVVEPDYVGGSAW
jgi:hypothetical protein